MEPGQPDAREEVPASSGEPELDFDVFFRRAYPQLVRGLAIAWGPDVAADVVQEAFVRAHRKWSHVSRLERPTAWVRRVAVNLLVDNHRRRKFERRVQAMSPAGVPWVPSVEDGYELEVAEALATLPERQRLAVGLYYLLDLPVSEVARQMRVPEGTAKAALFDARKALRSRMTRSPDTATDQTRPGDQ